MSELGATVDSRAAHQQRLMSLWSQVSTWLIAALLIVSTVGILATPYPLFCVVPILAVIGALFLGHYPLFAFYAVVFLLPFSGLRGPAHLVLIAFLIGYVVYIALKDQRLSPRYASNQWPWLGSYCAVGFLAAILPTNKSGGLTAAIEFFLCVLFFAVALYFIDNKGFKRYLPRILVTCVSLSSLLAVTLFVVAGEGRSEGVTASANRLALITILAIPFLIHGIVHNRRWRPLIIGLLAINLLSFGTTFSRGGFIVLVITLTGYFWKPIRKLPTIQLGILATIGLIAIPIIALAMPASYLDRIQSLGDEGDFSLGRRTSYLVVAKDAVLAYPVFGTGPMTFPEHYARSAWAQHFARKKMIESGNYRRRAHNTYVEVIVGTGIVGFCLFIGMIIRTLWNFMLTERRSEKNDDPETASLSRAYFWAFFSLVVYSLLESNSDMFYVLFMAASQASLNYVNSQGVSNDAVTV